MEDLGEQKVGHEPVACSCSPEGQQYSGLRGRERGRTGPGAVGREGSSGAFLPSVLVPRFHLRVGEVEGGGQLHPVLHAQVFLPLEAALQLGQLVVGEGGAGFARLFQPHRGAVPGTGDAEQEG